MAKVDIGIISDKVVTVKDFNVIVASAQFLYDALSIRGDVSMTQQRITGSITDDNTLTQADIDELISFINSMSIDIGGGNKINPTITENYFATIAKWTALIDGNNELYDDVETYGVNTSEIEFEYNYRGLSKIKTINNGEIVETRIDNFAKLPDNNTGYFLASYGGFSLGSTLINSTGDNIAPINYNGVFVGANHGWTCDQTTVVGHGKSFVDIGSVWTNGSTNWVLYSIVGDKLRFINEGGTRVALPSGTLTHVSGGTDTDPIQITSSALDQLYPSVGERTQSVEVDGVEILLTSSGNFNAKEFVKMSSTYIIYDRASLVEEIKTFAGTLLANFTDISTSTKDFLVTVNYYIGKNGVVTNPISYEALRDVPSFSYAMFLQEQTIITSTTLDYWYIPDTIPFNASGVDFDFSGKQLFSQLSGQITLTSARQENKIPTRLSMISNSKNSIFTEGFLPTKDGTETARAQKTSSACYFSTAEKGYMYGAQSSETGTTLSTGTVLELDGYKSVVRNQAERTNEYYVTDFKTGNTYLYIDWHNLPAVDSVPIRTDLIGYAYEIISKTDNVSASNGTLKSTLDVTVGDSKNYGYLVIKI